MGIENRDAAIINDLQVKIEELRKRATGDLAAALYDADAALDRAFALAEYGEEVS